MDLGFLDRSSQVTPLLVRLYDNQRLYGLARDKTPAARAELTDAVSDLLGVSLTSRESELIADILIELLRQAEKDLRQALAGRLAGMDNVPLRVVLQIANDEIDVAAPVLRLSPVLSDLDLVYLIRSKGPAYWQAIALRSRMGAQIVDALAETGDFETALALAENQEIRLTERAVLALSDLARGAETLAAPLLRRDEVTDEIAQSLYCSVGESLRNYIVENYDIDKDLVTQAMNRTISELTGQKQSPDLPAAQAAQEQYEKGLLTLPFMIGALRRGQIQSFIAQFAKFTSMTEQAILDIFARNAGQGIAAVCRAFGIGKADFLSLYLLTNRIRSSGRFADMKDLTRAIEFYNRMDREEAREILNVRKDLPSGA